MKLLHWLGLIPIVGIFAFWTMHGVGLWWRQAQIARVIAEIRPLLPNGPIPTEKQEPLVVAGKVLFWDLNANVVRRKAQEKLPEDLRARPGDSPLTVVLVADVRPGSRQTATVYLAHWPEPKVLGSATVPRGESNYYGDLEESLVWWVQSLPRIR